MTIIDFIIALVVFGVGFFLIDTYVPMYPVFKTVLRIVAVLVAIFLVAALFGVVDLPFKLK